MKDASSELSMTAIAVVAIAAVGVLFTTLIFPSIRGSLLASQRCSSAINCDCGESGNEETCTCNYYEEDGTVSTDTVQCENPNAE